MRPRDVPCDRKSEPRDAAGWCWLQSRFLLIGMAATPEGPGTRVAFTGGVRLPSRAALVPLGVRREGARSVEKLAALL
ncbi:hypothetical protein [Streptomyces sp. MK7]|uniref:hypothetical protein n=1 Tax=Streptomyces sp. MK7 TaxID=3067635 RepID=UPI00292CA619|nr:hypothetical protein [Streptomyces sp. MK7]